MVSYSVDMLLLLKVKTKNWCARLLCRHSRYLALSQVILICWTSSSSSFMCRCWLSH